MAKRDVLERDLEDLNERLKRTRDERTALDDEIHAAQSVISAHTRLEAKQNEHKFLTDESAKKAVERLDIISTAWKDLIENVVQVRRDQLESKRDLLLDTMKKHSGIEQRIAHIRAMLSNKECPTCKQSIREDRRAELGRDLGEAEAELSSIGKPRRCSLLCKGERLERRDIYTIPASRNAARFFLH